MNRQSLVEAIQKAEKICLRRPCVDCKYDNNSQYSVMYCMANMIADHLISLGLGTAEDLKLPKNVFQLAAAPRKLSEKRELAMQTSGFEIGVRMVKELNLKAFKPIGKEEAK